MQLEGQLNEKKVEPSFSQALKDWLAKKGFDPHMGARPMARLIQDTIRKALAEELLFGRLANGGRVTVDIDENEVVRLIFGEEAVALLPPPALPAPTN
jgi:ATP-dependent Clp protease ATP-binding subunit ClpA